jgi:hypothetical protein
VDDQNTELYKGISIRADALPEYEFWRSIFTLEKAMHRSESVAAISLCATEESALRQALRLGEKCIDPDGFSLMAYRLPPAKLADCPMRTPVASGSAASNWVKMKFEKGQALTNRDDPNVHCVVREVHRDTSSYSVTYPATGNTLMLSERLLEEHYIRTTGAEKQAAVAL